MQRNPNPQYVTLPIEQFGFLFGHTLRSMGGGTQQAMLTVTVRHLPEGVYLATSEALPGLIVEMATREEVISETQELAAELLEMRGLDPRTPLAFHFVR